jgi:hypothetical protein
MKLDTDIKSMSQERRGYELQRLRNLLRSHKKKRGHARCWKNDETFTNFHFLKEVTAWAEWICLKRYFSKDAKGISEINSAKFTARLNQGGYSGSN